MDIRPIPGTRNVMLLKDELAPTSLGTIVIPSGFVSDLASIPRAAWVIVSPFDPGVREAALLHDFLYSKRNARVLGHDKKTPIKITRQLADIIFYEELLDGGVPEWKAQSMYNAVRGWQWAKEKANRGDWVEK